MNIKKLHNDNQAAWDEAAEQYEADEVGAIEFLRNGGRNFEAPEFAYLDQLSQWCGRAVHLQCAGGKDTLSLWNQGAREVVGIDISPRMIGTARRRAEALGAPATWYCCDLLDTPAELNATADLVYTGRVALCWIMDIDGWACVVARLLKPGGRLYLYEGHPLDWIWDASATDLRLDPEYGNYFDRRVIDDQGWTPEYIGDLGKPREAHAVKHERQWLIGDILNALTGAGLRFGRLEEHPDTFWEVLPNLPDTVLTKLPHTYSLLMFKP
ncbi:MAG TPA: class I SAM-dependent methyltransferase [Capsulimonadaceae bacterium]|jgi:SAM-dependent methyltransferase